MLNDLSDNKTTQWLMRHNEIDAIKQVNNKRHYKNKYKIKRLPKQKHNVRNVKNKYPMKKTSTQCQRWSKQVRYKKDDENKYTIKDDQNKYTIKNMSKLSTQWKRWPK